MFSSAAGLPGPAASPYAALPPSWPPSACGLDGHDWGPDGTAETCARCGVHVLDVGVSWSRRYAQQCPRC